MPLPINLLDIMNELPLSLTKLSLLSIFVAQASTLHLLYNTTRGALHDPRLQGTKKRKVGSQAVHG
jgi:hypothetical protein